MVLVLKAGDILKNYELILKKNLYRFYSFLFLLEMYKAWEIYGHLSYMAVKSQEGAFFYQKIISPGHLSS